MTRPARSTLCARALPFAAAFAFAASAVPAFAQGTAAQREACAPDAITLCQDTIPDVAKTTACMKAHESELSPKCRAMFSAATGTPPESHASGEAPDDDAQTAGPPPDADADDDGLDSYRASIAKDCRRGLIDPFTCRSTMRVLNANR